MRAGRAADIVIGDSPDELAALAVEGHLMDVARYLDRDELRDAFGDYLVELTTVAPDGTSPAVSGGVYGLWVALYHESLIWHPAPEFEDAGYPVPTTWDELIDLSDRLVADGRQSMAPCRRAATTVFSRRLAIVIGPVPPGIGVSQPATSATAS